VPAEGPLDRVRRGPRALGKPTESIQRSIIRDIGRRVPSTDRWVRLHRAPALGRRQAARPGCTCAHRTEAPCLMLHCSTAA
jgi:hypothetical protein